MGNKNKAIKQKLRNKYLKILKNISIKDKKQLDKNIYQLFINSTYFNKYHVFALYYSLEYEVDTVQIILALLAAKKKVALPRIINNNLVFYYINSLSDLTSESEWKIYQPQSSNQIVKNKEIDLIILPVVAFNQNYYRLGHGSGHYDRYFADNEHDIKALKLALAYKIQEIPNQIIFTDKWDVRFDYLINND